MGIRHILLIFHHYRTPEEPGGLRSWHIGSHLARKGFSVTAVVPGVDTLSGQRHPRLRGRLWHREVIDGVQIIRVNATRNDRKSKARRALYYLSFSCLQAVRAFLVRKPDAIITTSMPWSSLLFSFILARMRRVPLVVDVRDLPTDAAVELGYFSHSSFVRLLLKGEGWIFKHSDQLIPVSHGMANLLKRKGVSANKIRVIPIGYDGREAYKQTTNWKRAIKSELGVRGKFVVLYAGTMGHVVDIPTVLNAAQETGNNKDVVYLFVGGGQRLEEFRKTAGIKRLSCMFLGPVPKGDIPLYCSQVDVCTYPLSGGAVVASLLGNKIFDYLGNGAATIYSGPEGDVARLIKRSGGGICVPAGDAKGLSEAINRLYRNPNTCKLLGKMGKEFVEKEYNVQKMMGEFEASVVQLLQ